MKIAIVTGSSKGLGRAIALTFAKSKGYSGIVINGRYTSIYIDVLVNNAGIQTDVPFEETTTQEWYRIIGVDLTGPFVCGREVAKHMEKQHPKGGCIVSISSVHQTIPKPHYVPYATSKAGLEMMTKTMALELAKDNIRVNLVAPGAILTDMNIELKENKVELDKVLKQIPIGRIGTPEE